MAFASTQKSRALSPALLGSENCSDDDHGDRPCAWRAGCLETVRRVTHCVNTRLSRAKFGANDFEAKVLPEPERVTEQEHDAEAGNGGRRVRRGPATPERYG